MSGKLGEDQVDLSEGTQFCHGVGGRLRDLELNFPDGVMFHAYIEPIRFDPNSPTDIYVIDATFFTMNPKYNLIAGSRTPLESSMIDGYIQLGKSRYWVTCRVK